MTDVPSFFFLNGDLHRKIKVVKTQNWIIAYNFKKERSLQYQLSHVLKEFQKAFRTRDVPKMLRVQGKVLDLYVERNMVNRPSGRAYNIETKVPGSAYWSEDDLLELRDRLYDLAPKDRDGYPSKRL